MSSFLINTLLRAPFRFVFLVAAAVSSPHFGQTGQARVLWRGFARLWRGWPTAHPDEPAEVRGTCLGRFLWDPALQKETGRKREVFPSHRKRTWIDHFCQRQTIGDEKSIYLARTLPRSHSEPKSGIAQFSQGSLGGKVMEGRDYWGARPPHPPYPGIQFGEKNIFRWANLILSYPFYFARRQLVRHKMLYCSLQLKNGLTNARHNFLTKRKLRRPKNDNGK